MAGETDDISEENAAAKKQFACSLCPKVCISQRGFTRHMNAKHKNQQTQSSSVEKQLSAEENLSPSTLKELLEVSATSLAANECYPPEMMAENHQTIHFFLIA